VQLSCKLSCLIYDIHDLSFGDCALQEWIAEYTASVLAERNTIQQTSREHRSAPNSSADGSDYNAVIV